jgi:hypothetical protein
MANGKEKMLSFNSPHGEQVPFFRFDPFLYHKTISFRAHDKRSWDCQVCHCQQRKANTFSHKELLLQEPTSCPKRHHPPKDDFLIPIDSMHLPIAESISNSTPPTSQKEKNRFLPPKSRRTLSISQKERSSSCQPRHPAHPAGSPTPIEALVPIAHYTTSQKVIPQRLRPHKLHSGAVSAAFS